MKHSFHFQSRERLSEEKKESCIVNGDFMSKDISFSHARDCNPYIWGNPFVLEKELFSQRIAFQK